MNDCSKIPIIFYNMFAQKQFLNKLFGNRKIYRRNAVFVNLELPIGGNDVEFIIRSSPGSFNKGGDDLILPSAGQ